MSLLDGFFSLQQRGNPAPNSSDTNMDGVSSPYVDALSLEMDDAELIEMKKIWEKEWGVYEGIILPIQEENENYWLGNQFNVSPGDRQLVDNIIFESLETFLPIATRPKADPLVDPAGNTPTGEKLANTVRKMLIYKGDEQCINLQFKAVVRNWSILLLGCMKFGWSEKTGDIVCSVVRPQNLILDPKATIRECEYTGYYVGERINDAIASDVIDLFPAAKDFISQQVQGKLGTRINYIQWSTNEYVFWTYKDTVLGKNKNPHWNYDREEIQDQVVDDYGTTVPTPMVIKGNNHFNTPKFPYIFFSIFNLGKRPHDDTNLIIQNLPLQDLINKRLSQIDKNADGANAGLILSGDSFTEEEAMTAGKRLRSGDTIWIPNGDVNGSVRRDQGGVLQPFIYESLIDYRNELRNIFGTRGSSAQGTFNEKTLGGKQIVRAQDSDRIGGGISTYLEVFADRAYNWMVQLMYVHYDEPHSATILGSEQAHEYITLSKADLVEKLIVGVKEGSMIPQDPMSKRNEAVELWGAKAIDPITLFDRLEFPNPREAAKQLYLWNADPIQLFPDLLAKKQAEEAAAMAQQQQMQAEQEAQQQALAEQDRAINHNNDLQKMQLQNALKQQVPSPYAV